MPAPDSSVVDLIRDFLAAHRRLRAVAARHRSGQLEFSEVQSLVGEGEGSVLYRLKERCHNLYRALPAPQDEIGPGALFDLAVGSLFHEAMKFREGFYQLSAYGPKLEGLRHTDRAEARALLTEFEKILDETRLRIDDSLAETEVLLDWISGQLLPLLHEHVEEGSLARFLVEHSSDVAEVTGASQEALLADLYGSVEAARIRAAHSYLDSGFYDQALTALGDLDDVSAGSLRFYAEGMSAFLEGRYAACVEQLGGWVANGNLEQGLANLAISALGRVGRLVEGEAGLPEAAELSERIRGSLA
jgi:hypothetical protein